VREFGLDRSGGAANRILHQHKLTRKHRRKHKSKNELREVKVKLAAFDHFQTDTKPLFDIPEYYPSIVHLSLPRHQYSIREVPTGPVFVSYVSELSTTYACLCIKRFLEHLRRCGKDLSKCLPPKTTHFVKNCSCLTLSFLIHFSIGCSEQRSLEPVPCVTMYRSFPPLNFGTAAVACPAETSRCACVHNPKTGS